MTSITADTKLIIKKKVAGPSAGGALKKPSNTAPTLGIGTRSGAGAGAKKKTTATTTSSSSTTTAGAGTKRGAAPPLKPATLHSPAAIQEHLMLLHATATTTTTTTAQQQQQQSGTDDKLTERSSIEACRIATIQGWFQKALGSQTSVLDLSIPHAASTTRTRGNAAADVAVAAKILGMPFVWHVCKIGPELTQLLFPMGIQTLFERGVTLPKTIMSGGNHNHNNGGMGTSDDEGEEGSTTATGVGGGGLKPSASAVSLTSLENNYNPYEETTTGTSVYSAGTDTKRGKMTPPNAREGCLLLLRALCQITGKPAEPYIVGAFLWAALDECGSSNSAVREAAQDTATALVGLAHPWSFPSVVSPLLLQALHATTEWRVKTSALECLEQCATITASKQVQRMIPTLIPVLSSQVFDTKPQVSKAAKATLTAVCQTNLNADIRPAIPAIINAICKPADANKAVTALMGTTFVVPVDASTLAILCPILARALKEKLAIHKRAACIVISNMSKLVQEPAAVAPFGSLLVPELQKVATNVQFEEIRDEALKALNQLTKALGDSYKATEQEDAANDMHAEQIKVQAEQDRIRQLRDEGKRKEDELKRKEEEERRKFKEAMDAQRELDRVAAEEADQKRKDKEDERERQRLSTKDTTGICQSCFLKKCKKSCMFYAG